MESPLVATEIYPIFAGPFWSLHQWCWMSARKYFGGNLNETVSFCTALIHPLFSMQWQCSYKSLLKVRHILTKVQDFPKMDKHNNTCMATWKYLGNLFLPFSNISVIFRSLAQYLNQYQILGYLWVDLFH